MPPLYAIFLGLVTGFFEDNLHGNFYQLFLTNSDGYDILIFVPDSLGA